MNTYPVNLILSGRRCLLIGGGKVATRKLEKLLPTGAIITVVAPEPSERIIAAAEAGHIVLQYRTFTDNDLNGVFLVYAATDDHARNRKITTLAEARGILVCSVDQNWIGGSFITPASLNKDDVTIAVSTNGVSCRKAKLIKENLARHLTAIENAELLILGTDHRHLPQAKRESFHPDAAGLLRIGSMLQTLWGLQGFMLLNTCNRIELIAVANPDPALHDILKMILRLDQLAPEQFYLKTGFDAFAHLTLTAAGLHSQQTGENHITAQLKEAGRIALENQWTGGVMQTLLDQVLHISKHIRSTAAKQRKTEEIEDTAMAFIKANIPKLKKRNVLLAGTGSVGKEMMSRLAVAGACINWLYHSKLPETTAPDVTPAPLSQLPELLPAADLVITALTSAHPIITPALADRFKPGALVVDLGVPRNVNAQRADVTFITMENLPAGQKRTASELDHVFAAATNIITEHRELYDKFIRSYTDGNSGQPSFAGPDATNP